MVETESRIVIELPVEKEFARLLRLLVSGIASRMNFNLDAVDDLKIAVEESFLMALRRQAPNPLRVSFNIRADGLYINFKGLGSAPVEPGPETFGNFILDAVVDEIDHSDSGDGVDLRLVKYL